MHRYIPYFEFVAFLTSLFALPVIKKSKYLRLFPLLLLMIVLVEVYQLFFAAKGSVNAGIYNIMIPLQYLLYLIILHEAVDQQRYKRFLLVASVVLIVFSTLTGLFVLEDNHFNVLAYCLGSVLVIIGALMKLYEMLQNPTDFNFLRKPFFYMLFAFLLFTAGTLPYFAMSNWLYIVTTHKNVLLMLANVMSIMNYILYSTYTVMFLWMIQRKDYS